MRDDIVAMRALFARTEQRREIDVGDAEPPRLDEKTFRQYIEGLEFIGFGRPESLTSQNAIVSGIQIAEPERAPATASLDTAPSTERPERDASTLIDQPPDVIRALTGDLVVRF